MSIQIDPAVLERVCNEVIAADLESGEMFQLIRDKLHEEYPHIIDKQARPWIGSRAGGILGKMSLLYVSMNEYLIIFGCPASSAGFSGRYNFVEIWDFFLTGETTTCDLESDQIKARAYKPGEVGYLEKGQACSVEIKAGSWMIEYGRGPNITALPFALMDSLVSSVELRTFFDTVSEYVKVMVKNRRFF